MQHILLMYSFVQTSLMVLSQQQHGQITHFFPSEKWEISHMGTWMLISVSDRESSNGEQNTKIAN